MTSVSPDRMTSHLIKVLVDEDALMRGAADALDQARTNFEVELRKYAAIRDMVASHTGMDPYGTEMQPYLSRGGWTLQTEGRYRFAHMTPGDAVTMLLKAAPEPITLENIVAQLNAGGLSVAPRGVNAALMTLVRTGDAEKVAATPLEALMNEGYRYVWVGRKTEPPSPPPLVTGAPRVMAPPLTDAPSVTEEP